MWEHVADRKPHHHSSGRPRPHHDHWSDFPCLLPIPLLIMPTRFDALKSARAKGGDESSSSSDDDDQPNAKHPTGNFEDLSSYRADEETVLAAVYGGDFSSEEGVWGCARLNVRVRPPDIAREQVGSEFTLSAQLGKKYPYVAPKLELRNVKGLTRQEQQDLLALLNARAHDCAATGTVMMCEIIQEAEDYLLEHNKDPAKANMSAWEQMKEREAAQEEAERKQQEDQEAYRKQFLDDSSNHQRGKYEMASVDKSGGADMTAAAAMEAERELQKQMETLDAAFADRKKRIRKLHSDFIDEADEDQSNAETNPDDDFIDFDEDSEADADDAEQRALMASTASSRYKSDFIELGLLGRGGGGEVVKARNFLDRRIYAIKKIPLESETGRYAEIARVNNRKLRREVTTISRMTHNNIVRYYQAWVEGEAAASSKSEKVDGIGEEIIEEDDSNNQSESDSGDSSGGFWKNSPALGPLQNDENYGSFESSSGIDLGNPLQGGTGNSLADALHSQSTSALLEHEFEEFQNPLFVGGTFENKAYNELVTAAPTKIRSSATPSNHLGSGLSGLLEDDTSVKVDENAQTLFIQMEYCSNTLRHLIDSGDLKEMKPVEIWRMARQTIEALGYIHGKQIIHRDLKPGNIFLDSESNVRLGDFGLATLHSSKRADESNKDLDEDMGSEAQMIHDAVENISGLIGGSSSRRKRSQVSRSSSLESLTGGVGTTFYRAPEQEGRRHGKGRSGRDDTTYDMKADIFSFGIVLFEIFSNPFSTYMERAETLLRLRGEIPADPSLSASKQQNGAKKDWRAKAKERFPENFVSTVPEAAQQMILWCTESRPEDRPSAEELLKSDLLPKRLELESRYLQDALQILSNPQNESNRTILSHLFDRPTPAIRDTIFDTDVSVKSRGTSHLELLAAALRSLGIYSQRDIDSLRSTALGSASCSQLAAILALKRMRQATKRATGGSELLRGAPQRTAINIAALSASSAAVTGSADGLLGTDPTLVERICDTCANIFKQHGATRLEAPLLRPRTSRNRAVNETDNAPSPGGPAEILNTDGIVLLLPEDSTSNFARAIARGGCSSLKRYSISKVFHRSLAGGHPTEKLEASFDIIQNDQSVKAEVFQAETIFLLCQILFSIDTPTTSYWFLRISHTRLTDSILDVCGVPASESTRRAVLRILTSCTAPSPTSWRNAKSSNGVDFKNYLEIAKERHGLPKASADRLLIVFSKECLPLPSADADKACEFLHDGIERLRHADTQSKALSRGKLKRFEDAHRSLKSIRLCLSLMKALGIQTSGTKQEKNHRLSSPSFVSFDLGFRQKRRHYHGQLLFQAIAVSSDYAKKVSSKHENLDVFLGGGDATRLAEGGRYDDFVRKNRPPGGTFGSSIPICTGLRIFIGSLVEQAYQRAAEISQDAHSSTNRRGSSMGTQIESIRCYLGHPLPPHHPIKCIVSGTNGLDSASLGERARLAALLWRDGIASEYTINASALTSPLLHRSVAGDGGAANTFSLEELTGVSSILRIPFIVVAQPHLLREKGSVRLRHIVGEGFEEDFVPLEELASKMKEQLAHQEVTAGAARGANNTESVRMAGRQSSSTGDDNKASTSAAVQCIYCDETEYHIQHDLEKRKGSSSDKATAKAAKKELSRAMQKAEAYIHCMSTSSSMGQGTPVIASALPYLVLRDLGTALVTSASTSDAITGVAARNPNYRRLLKTVGMSIDHALSESMPSHKRLELLLYSIPDDRFDLIQIGDRLKPAPGSPDHRRHRSSSFDVSKGSKRR